MRDQSEEHKMEQQQESSGNDTTPVRRRQRVPRPQGNGATATVKTSPKKRGRPKKPEGVSYRSYELVLSRGREARLEMPNDLSADDVEAVKMQIDAIWKLAEIQEGIREVAK